MHADNVHSPQWNQRFRRTSAKHCCNYDAINEIGICQNASLNELPKPFPSDVMLRAAEDVIEFTVKIASDV